MRFVVGGSKGYFNILCLRRCREVSMIRNFRELYRGSDDGEFDDFNERLCKLTGGFSSKVGFGLNIALMDIDYPDFKDETVEMLKQRKIAHTVVESSPDRFWIIVDKISIKPLIVNFISKFAGVDSKYISMSSEVGFNLRAFPKGDKVPHIVDSYGTGGKTYRKFIKEFDTYWKNPHISWMTTEYIINNI